MAKLIDLNGLNRFKQNLNTQLDTKLDTKLMFKQDNIVDLNIIRSGARAGATAYQKPRLGIPKSDLNGNVQLSLDKADSALQEQSLDNYYTKKEVTDAIAAATPEDYEEVKEKVAPITIEASGLSVAVPLHVNDISTKAISISNLDIREEEGSYYIDFYREDSGEKVLKIGTNNVNIPKLDNVAINTGKITVGNSTNKLTLSDGSITIGNITIDSGFIVQGTGDSTTSVMSQKAVTDAIAAATPEDYEEVKEKVAPITIEASGLSVAVPLRVNDIYAIQGKVVTPKIYIGSSTSGSYIYEKSNVNDPLIAFACKGDILISSDYGNGRVPKLRVGYDTIISNSDIKVGAITIGSVESSKFTITDGFIVHGTGNDTTKVMSQKAVTDAIKSWFGGDISVSSITIGNSTIRQEESYIDGNVITITNEEDYTNPTVRIGSTYITENTIASRTITFSEEDKQDKVVGYDDVITKSEVEGLISSLEARIQALENK